MTSSAAASSASDASPSPLSLPRIGFAGRRRLLERSEVDRLVLFGLEHDVGLERLHHLRVQFEQRQLQQLDGLLQLRGHRELLTELELQGRLEHQVRKSK